MFLRLIAFAFVLLALPARAEVDIQEITSPGGINIWLVEEPSIPYVALEIRLRGGAGLDLPDKRGATNLMASLLNEGSGDMDARAFAEVAEELAVRFRFSVHDDALSISASMLTENRDAAADLLRLALTEPRFDADAVERMRADVALSIQSAAVSPNSIAADTFYGMAFPGHPYGSNQRGTLDSVAALTREDVVTAYTRAVTRDDVYVGVVGDISAAEVGPLLDHILGGLPAEGPERPGRIDFALDPGVIVVDFPTPQSVAFFGHVGILRDDPRFFAASILNQILGDGVQSRLMQELRERRGLTYGVGTFLVPRDLSEMYLGSFASSNATMAMAVDLVAAEWARIAEDGITQEELDLAKTYMTGEYPLRFASNDAIAGILVGMQMADLPADYVIHRNDYVNAVTLDEANRVASEIYHPDLLHFVVVGQPAGLETGPLPDQDP